jgi:hypothetical protein
MTLDRLAPVCRGCATDDYLWEAVVDSARRRKCAICEKVRLCAPLELIAEHVDEVFRNHVQIGEIIKTYGLHDDRGEWEQQGDPPSLLMQEIVGCDVDLADALVEVLGEGEWDVVRDGGEPFYDTTSNYVYAPDGVHEHHLVWRDFQKRVKFEGRFLDPRVQGQLEELFTEFPDEWTAHADGPVRHLDVGSVSIFRARASPTPDAARSIIGNAAAELSPPPPQLRVAGRLNAQGIGVFYGGFSEDVCIAELRPSLGSHVVVARFEPLRPIKVLDLTGFDRHRPTGSLFRPGFNDERLRWRFLQSFHWNITQPVQPGAEALDYVPTQVIGEYLHTVLGYDGLIYRSAQVGMVDWDDPDEDPAPTPPELRNLALFGNAGLVETQPAGEVKPAAGTRRVRIIPALLGETSFGAERPEPALRYIEESAVVYRINKISYEWDREHLAHDVDSLGWSPDDFGDVPF